MVVCLYITTVTYGIRRRMESIQEKFAEQRAGERLKREQNVVEKERAKLQKKIESKDSFKRINKDENYGNIK